MTVIATGRLVHESLRAAEEAESEGISVEVVDPRTLQPLDEETLVGVGEEDEPRRRRARGGDADGLRRRGRGRAPVPGVRLARRADRARRREVRAAAVRAGDGEVRRPARRRRARGDQAHGRQRRDVATEVKLPRLGQGMESGTIVRWLKSEGDAVEKGEPLYELDTDKVTQEVEAEASGVLLKIAVAEGEVAVGRTVAFIGERGRGRARGRGRRRRAAPRSPRQKAAAASAAGGRCRAAGVPLQPRRRTAASRRRRSRAGSRASAASISRRFAAPAPRAASSPRTSSAPRRRPAAPASGRAGPAGEVERRPAHEHPQDDRAPR